MTDQNSRPRVALPGSERSPLKGSQAVGPVDPDERIEVSVYLRAPVGSDLATDVNERAVRQQKPLSREEYANRYSASAEDIAQIEQFAREHHLDIVETNAARRVVILSGTVDAISAAFGVQLQQHVYQDNTYRARTGTLSVPAELVSLITGVFGIDNRPQARPHIQPRAKKPHTISYTPPQLAQIYDFPQDSDGSGQTIGIIELGGGYRTDDLTKYFGALGIAVPEVVSVSVDGGKNAPSTPDSDDGEVCLDIEVIGGVAPGAKMVVYFAPNTDAGFLDAITTAIHDTVNAPSVISISWGQAESSWTEQAMQNMDQAFQAAAALGVTVCAAAGDGGSGDRVQDGLAHVDFPASDPYVLGCGGTSLQSSNGVITSEVVWDDNPTSSATGGGVSDVFGLPDWQTTAGVPSSANPGGRIGRGVPDIAGDADPNTGYVVLVDGQSNVYGGTSAVAPLWAGLIARINQLLSTHAGYLNPTLYQLGSQAPAFHNITVGNNGAYSARPGWNACTGLGSPNGAQVLTALTPAAIAGD
jgi:kumamolisin